MAKPIQTDLRTTDGLIVYDLDPQSSELWAIAGPHHWDPEALALHARIGSLPLRFRWVNNDEWSELQNQH